MTGRRRAIIIIIVAAAVLAAASAFYLTYDRQPVKVLTYHHVVPDGAETNSMTVTASRLEADFRALAEGGYNVVLPREYLGMRKVPRRTVIISFDDGYLSNYEIAYPLLQEYNLKAVISVICKNIDEHPNFCSWEQLREMSDSGLVEIASHTDNLHNPEIGGAFYSDRGNGVQRINKDESDEEFSERVLADIVRSYDKIEAGTGAAPVTFTYPFGVCDPDADEIIEKYFRISFVTEPARGAKADRCFKLHRKTVYMESNLEDLL